MSLALLFFVVAAIYSTAGFGGGSAYIALMTLFGVPYERIPVVALTCNLIVVSAGVYHFARAGHLDWRALWPWVAGSVPAALVGGRMPITQPVFLWLLGGSLLAAGAALAWPVREPAGVRSANPAAAFAIGGGLGLLSGMVGIGGGIFLSPLVSWLRWATPKQAAAMAAAFIWLNSAAGLVGQLWKRSLPALDGEWALLAAAVLAGGQLGSRLGAGRIPQARVRQVTGLVVIAAGVTCCARLVAR